MPDAKSGKVKGLSAISWKILEVLKSAPEGLTSGQIRIALGLGPGEQSQLDRRRRNLYPYFIIEKLRRGRECRYLYRGEKDPQHQKAVNLRLRAEILHRARGRCGMCGRSIDRDQVRLVVDHKVPQDWGGRNEPSNLWAICEECNAGKKNLFKSFDAALMQKVMSIDSPHMRIGELLKLNIGKPVPGWLIEFVAFDQDDWQKRTRELRYLGWDLVASRKKNKSTGRVEASYTLKSFTPWPEDPTKWIREFEAKRAHRNRNEI